MPPQEVLDFDWFGFVVPGSGNLGNNNISYLGEEGDRYEVVAQGFHLEDPVGRQKPQGESVADGQGQLGRIDLAVVVVEG